MWWILCVVLPIRLYRVRLTQCSCVDVWSLDLVIDGCSLYGSSSSRMSTRRLPVITLYLYSSAYYILLCFAWCVYGGRGGWLFICAFRRIKIWWLFQSLLILSSSRHLLRLSNNLSACDLLGLWYSWLFYYICYMYYMSVCCPYSAGYQSDHPQSWHPWTPIRS